MKNFRLETKYRGKKCLNCDHPLDISDRYCPYCGQLNSTKKLSFEDFFNELFAGIFAYDSRFRKTLTTLLFNPGKISRDYIQGKRMRYANPFKFYLSVSIIFFLIWNFSTDFENYESIANTNAKELEELTEEELTRLKADLNGVPFEVSSLNIDSLILQRKNSQTYKEEYISQTKLDSLGLFRSFIPQVKLYNKFYDQTLILQPSKALDSVHHNNSSYNRWVYEKVVDFNAMKSNPNIFWDYFVGKLPFIIFFYLPVFALFIWLLYMRKKYNYMEHLIFAFHIQTTFFIIAGFSLLTNLLFNTEFFTEFMTMVFLFYLYKAMRRFYSQGRLKTIVKFLLLNGIFLILAVIATIFSLIASFAIY